MDRFQKIKEAIEIYDFESTREYKCHTCLHKHPAPTGPRCPFADMLEESSPTNQGKSTSKKQNEQPLTDESSDDDQGEQEPGQEGGSGEVTPDEDDITAESAALRNQLESLQSEITKLRHQAKKGRKLKTKGKSGRRKKASKVQYSSPSSTSSSVQSSSASDDSDSVTSSASSSSDEDNHGRNRKKQGASKKRSKVKKMVEKKAKKMIKKRALKNSGLNRTGEKYVKVGFLWPQQHIWRADGHRPFFKELSACELALGIKRMSNEAKENGKKQEARDLMDFMERVLEDLAEFNFRAVLRSVQKAMLLVEQGVWRWSHKKQLQEERDRVINRNTSKSEGTPSKTSASTAPADNDKGTTLVCYPYQRGECGIKGEFHHTAKGKLYHYCNYCLTSLNKRWRHPESKCGKKNPTQAPQPKSEG